MSIRPPTLSIENRLDGMTEEMSLIRGMLEQCIKRQNSLDENYWRNILRTIEDHTKLIRQLEIRVQKFERDIQFIFHQIGSLDEESQKIQRLVAELNTIPGMKSGNGTLVMGSARSLPPT